MWANKISKGFNTTDVPLELCLEQVLYVGDGLRDAGQAILDHEVSQVGLTSRRARPQSRETQSRSTVVTRFDDIVAA